MRSIGISPLLIWLAAAPLIHAQVSTPPSAAAPDGVSTTDEGDTAERMAKAITHAIAAGEDVLALERRDNIAASKQASVVHHAGTLLVSAGRDQEALSWLQAAVRLAPHRLDWQWSLAQTQNKLGNTQKAKSLAALVYERAEDGDLISQSATLLGKKPQWTVPPMTDTKPGEPVICLTAAGPVQPWLIHAAARSIESRLGVPVRLTGITLDLGKPDRTNAESVAAQARQQIIWSSAFTRRVMKELNIQGEQAATDEDVVTLLATLMLEAGQKTAAMNWLNAYAEESERPQWSAELLAGKAGNAYREPNATGPRVLLNLVLTEADIFQRDSNYVFAVYWSPPPSAVVSAARFKANFYGTTPNRARLQERIEKQLLTSIGHAARVTRCSDPRCVRAYPASLDEFDAKGSTYCADCQAGMERFLGRSLPSGKRGE